MLFNSIQPLINHILFTCVYFDKGIKISSHVCYSIA